MQLGGAFQRPQHGGRRGVGEALDLEPEAIRAGLEGVHGVPGRMERVDAGQPFVVVVDYAHTADALAKVLDELAPVAAAGGGALVAVFGSAGDRDRVKRPAMGRVAGSRCRLVVLTDEDPRTEDRQAILEAIAIGAEEAGRHRGRDLFLVPDRQRRSASPSRTPAQATSSCWLARATRRRSRWRTMRSPGTRRSRRDER